MLEKPDLQDEKIVECLQEAYGLRVGTVDFLPLGAGLLGNWYSPQEEEALFYPAFGQTQIDQNLLAYYRYERIVQDIAAFCEELLFTEEGGADRAQSLRFLQSNFLPNSTITIAYQSDKTHLA